MSYHYDTFMALYHGTYLPLRLHSGPATHGHPGYNTAKGLVALLRVWGEHVVHHRRFTGKIWGVHLGKGGTLQGSYRVRLHLHHWMLGNGRTQFLARIRGSRIFSFTLRGC